MIKIVSWNVNGIRSNIICEGSMKKNKKILKELPNECNLKNLIDEHKPDIICFQETKCSEAIGKQFQFNEYPFKYWNESKGDGRRGSGYSGTSIWSKIKPEFIDDKYINDSIIFKNEEGRFLIAKFKTFDLINVYVPNSGTNYEYRISEWDKNIHSILEEYKNNEKLLIYTGDLNVVSNKLDIWNPTILESKDMNPKTHNGLLKDERDNFNKFINELEYIDVFRHLHKDKVEYSWWDQRTKCRPINKGRRIDYFLILNKYIELVNNSSVITDIMGSDHCPISIELKF